MTTPAPKLVISVPDHDMQAALGAVPPGVEVRVWDLTARPARPDEIDVVVPPYMVGDRGLDLLGGLPGLRLVQLLTAGFDHVLPHLPAGVALANGVGIHDTSTAELAVTLALAVLRGVPEFVRAQDEGRWIEPGTMRLRSLADRRVLVVGFGGVGAAVASRMHAFEASVTGVASRPRPTGVEGVPVHGIADLPWLLPDHDVVVLAVPLTDRTRGMVDADFLAAMPDGAVLVNVARGGVVRTDALLAELRAGRLLAALDVTDPEPLPVDHPLWHAPGVLVSPHAGGNTSAFWPRAVRLLTDQLTLISTGGRPHGIVISNTWTDTLTPDERDDRGHGAGEERSESHDCRRPVS